MKLLRFINEKLCFVDAVTCYQQLVNVNNWLAFAGNISPPASMCLSSFIQSNISYK